MSVRLQCRPSFSRSSGRGRLTTFGRSRGIYSFVASIGVGMIQLYKPGVSIVNYSALLGLAVLFHRDDDIPLFVSCVDVPVSLDNVFQRIASVYDRLYLSRFNQLCEEM